METVARVGGGWVRFIPDPFIWNNVQRGNGSWDYSQPDSWIREAQRHGRWFRNVGRMTCDYCQFSELCLQGLHVEPDNPPAGYEILADVHGVLITT